MSSHLLWLSVLTADGCGDNVPSHRIVPLPLLLLLLLIMRTNPPLAPSKHRRISTHHNQKHSRLRISQDLEAGYYLLAARGRRLSIKQHRLRRRRRVLHVASVRAREWTGWAHTVAYTCSYNSSPPVVSVWFDQGRAEGKCWWQWRPTRARGRLEWFCFSNE